MRHLATVPCSLPLHEKRLNASTLRPFNLCNVLPLIPVSQHRSLRGASTIAAKRNVLKRFERVDLLKKRGQWKETSKVIGLPKTKPDV